MLLALGAVSWVGARAWLAKTELEALIPLAQTVQDELIEGDSTTAKAAAVELVDHADRAAALTSDPIWRAFELVPGIGVNLLAVGQVAQTAASVSNGAVVPLVEVAAGMQVDSFKPVDGRVEVQPLVDAQPGVATAKAVLVDAGVKLSGVDTSKTVRQISDAVGELRTLVAGVGQSVDSVDRAVRLVPAMLGAGGARDYLVLFQNPAELRATGGITGAIALLHTDAGQMSLVDQVSSTSYSRYSAPVLDLPLETRGIYGDITGQFIQDINLTPNFVQSAALAQEMWRLQYGQTVDGVLSIDPVALSYLLRATGPITLPTGDVLSAENAVQLLLTDVYAAYPDTGEQDSFFAAAAASVFSTIAGGGAEPTALIKALLQSADERRILIWSADEGEQSVLTDTTLAGGLPISDSETQRFGVYLNDATGAKMGPYLDVQTGVGQVTCRKDKRPTYAVDVTLTNNAPADAASSLPGYVTAEGNYGVAAGNIKTVVSVYGAEDMENLGVLRDGAEVGYHPAMDGGYPVSGIGIELAPGETATVRFSWLGAAAFSGNIETQLTPVIHRNETNKLDLGC